MTYQEFEFETKIKAKARPRVTRFVTYSPSEKDERLLRQLLERDYPGVKMIEDQAIEINIEFYFKPPKNTPKYKLREMLRGDIPRIKKPDLDNLIKLVIDAFNGVLYKDDNLIYKISAEKVYHIYEDKIVLSLSTREDNHVKI